MSDDRRVSLWEATVDMPTSARLLGQETAEVCVIGGGIVGLCTALLLQREGVRTVLVEAGELACGASGYTTAKLTAQHGTIYSRLVKQLGIEQARQYASAQVAGMNCVRTQVERLGIDCDLEERIAWTWASSDAELERLVAEDEAARSVGLPSRMAERCDLPLMQAGAMAMDRQLQFHPRKFLAGIAREFERLGGILFTHSRVHEIDAHDQVTVRCDEGEVVCERAVVATHLPIINRSLHFAMATYRRSYAIAYDAADFACKDMYITSGGATRSIRQAASGNARLVLVGGEGHEVGKTDGLAYERLDRWARAHLDLGELRYTWSTQDVFPVDHHPFVGRLLEPGQAGRDRIYGATGFAGWGMSGGVGAALVLAALLVRGHSAWEEVFDADRLGALMRPKALVKGAESVKAFASAHLPLTGHGQIDEIAPGEGRIVSVGAHRVAAARSADGELRACSAVCTHMGCEVAFNAAEQSWDCPCHGSRFDRDGSVLEGPATKPLARLDVVHVREGKVATEPSS
jgi:glycine/D-amino acid oxidase-like deaminating enzyme/nitrite reductase/ring-hydroxylating ferredoxin subunit